MKESEKYDWIEQWTAGQLQGTALKEFEEALKTDTELAELVEMHQDLNRSLATSNKNAVRSTFEEIRKKNTPSIPVQEEKGKSTSRLLFIGLFLVTLLALLYWLSSKQTAINIPSEKEAIEQPKGQKNQEQLVAPIEKVLEKPQKEIPEQLEQKSKPNPENKATKKEKKKPIGPIASTQDTTVPDDLLAAIDPADFQANPYLDLQMEGVRNSTFSIDLTSPSLDSRLLSDNGVSKISVSGTIQAKQLPETIQLSIFDNKKESYENYEPVFAAPLVLGEGSDDEFSFSVYKELKLKSGLYYLLFEDEKTGGVLKVSRFEVR